MIENRRFLAVVPARGGSKSVPQKNIRSLGGRPLLHHTVDQLQAVTEIDCAVVSTDDEKIRDVAKSVGVRVIDRPAELSGDTAPTELALIHALDKLADQGEYFDYVMVLEPTSPFRSSATIRRCMNRIVRDNGQSLMTVIETRSNIGVLEEGYFKPLNSGAPRRRQEREPFFVESSTVYISRVDFLRETGSLVCQNWLSEIVEENEAIDINSPLDFKIAEAIFSLRTMEA